MGNREKLLAAARRCLHEKGYARTTARDLVAASGANLASIGYHFGSKEALLTQAMVEELGEWVAELGRALSAGAGDTPLRRLESMWAHVIESFTTRQPLWFASFQAFAEAERSGQLRGLLADGYQQARPWMAATLGTTEVGAIDDRTARTVGSFLLALQAGLAAQWLLDPGNAPSAADVTEGLLRILAAVAPGEAGRDGLDCG